MADHSERIAEIREALRTGVSQVSTDGTTTSFDLDALRQELRQLMAEDDAQKARRPVAASIYLGGF